MVRHQFLVLAFAGSNPAAPAIIMKYNIDVAAEVSANGYGWLNGAGLDPTSEELKGLEDLAPLWDDLVLDPYLKVEGTTRLRKYSRYDLDVASGDVARLSHELFSQGEEHNPLFGGQERKFEPCPPELDENPYFLGLAGLIRQALPDIYGHWQMRTHMVRIQVTGGESAQPVPEGPHRDGYDYICISMIGRTGVSGGETTIYKKGEEAGTRTLINPGDGLILDDRRYTHDTTPLSLIEGNDSGSRDVFLFGFEPITV